MQLSNCAIQELAGHNDLLMTQRYMHLSPAPLDSAIRLLDQPPSRKTLEITVEPAAKNVADLE
jgi:hypothetical protein